MEEEEEEAEVTEVGEAAMNLIDVLRRAHQQNGRLHYYATSDLQRRGRSTMPVTPFVFELFIYNSIYQVDWPASLRGRQVVNHQDCTESKQQRELEKFLKPHLREQPALLYGAFTSIRDAGLEGDWTAVVADSRISAKEGDLFFERLRRLREILRVTGQPEALHVNKCLDLIANCRWYVYLVRNSIFHGSKRSGETYETRQRQRLEVYLSFTRCLNQSFFSVCDKIARLQA